MNDISKAALITLYRTNRVSIEGLKEAVNKNIITKEQYTEITGELYSK